MLNLEENIMNRRGTKVVATLIFLIAAPLAPSFARNATPQPPDLGSAEDEAAIKQVVAGFSEGWNLHDAHSMCVSLADYVQWVNWRGEVLNSRKDVEEQHATLFAALYKNTHRTDTVKSIRYFTPELASVDNYWTMTGAKTRDGAEWPYREGYANYVMAKRNGRWVIIVSHTADFNAKAPAPANRERVALHFRGAQARSSIPITRSTRRPYFSISSFASSRSAA
jgi:uncharacterized protein (TIGR02246 family)